MSGAADTGAVGMTEITILTKTGGPLTKRISLDPDGKMRSDGSACVMSGGSARRASFDNLDAFAASIGGLGSNEAIALGALRDNLPDQVQIVTKAKLATLNGATPPETIARTGKHISYRPGMPALALLDHDTGGMPPAVQSKIDALGGFWSALVSVVPKLATAGRVERASTSAGLSRTDTGEKLPGSNGLHVYVLVQDGADVERLLRTLHDRCWLQGLGWMMVGAGGQLLDRSIVDRMVGAPERLVFEGPPILDPPLAQDQASRQPIVTEGTVLDTVEACPPLTIVEQAQLKKLRAKEQHRLAPDAAKARDTFISQQSKRLAKRPGMSFESAKRAIARQCVGTLLPGLVLPFDDEDLAGATVADVLADPARFEGATLADPLEGTEYGRCKAKIMRRADGSPWIHSFAHGRTVYELKYDARAVQAALKDMASADVPDAFVRLVLTADMDEAEIEELRNIAHERSGIGKRALDAKLKRARQEQAMHQATAIRERRTAERQDPRPYLEAPLVDAERVPIMTAIDDVLGSQRRPEPPFRDAEGRPTEVRCRAPIMLHEMLNVGTNPGEPDETDLPAGTGDAVADTS
jgi:hypothetical protein